MAGLKDAARQVCVIFAFGQIDWASSFTCRSLAASRRQAM
jgi:hypothetical protein